MHNVVLALESICEEAQLEPMEGGTSGPEMLMGNLLAAAQTFVSRLEDLETRTKVEELKTQVETRIGAEVVDILTGVYNRPRLHRFLLANTMDVQDATSAVIQNYAGRVECKMDAKREEIVGSDLGFSTIPRAEEFRSFFPNNPFLARTKDGNVARYFCIGDKANITGFRAAFAPKDSADLLLYHEELTGMILDALSAMEARNISCLTFFDCSYRQVTSMFGLMEREFFRQLKIGTGTKCAV